MRFHQTSGYTGHFSAYELQAGFWFESLVRNTLKPPKLHNSKAIKKKEEKKQQQLHFG